MKNKKNKNSKILNSNCINTWRKFLFQCKLDCSWITSWSVYFWIHRR